MAFEILMPKLSSTMEVGSITQWLKEEGETVETGEAIFEVMTDKIAIEVESYEDGILLKRYYDVDQDIPINAVIGYIGEAGEEVPEEAPRPNQATPAVETAEQVAAVVIEQGPSREQVRATPAARKVARQRGIDLQKISGSGTNGRIHVVDVEQYQPVSLAERPTEERVIPWRGMRKAIADAMVKSKTEKPHVTMLAEVSMVKAIQLRQTLLPLIEAQTGYRLSYTEIIIKAVTTALKKHPSLNGIIKEDGIHQFSQVNMGVAVSLEEGLMVPVIPNANDLGLAELTVATKEVAVKARTGNLPPDALKGGTFTISSLGNSAVRSFNPVINGGEVAILGVGGLYDGPISTEEGLKMAKQLTLSLSFDHRALDGAPAAAFLTTVVSLLEEPYRLLV
ncbi:2-oxo acid dehydrogenase subunit E2 [Vagococcus sp. BWB3-3]|uniref:Dihydrolipoamide acetyltransferase component of pyruvate dehydrogenase complex n=1 Tax=Vagococcus allomyrinae TaxID=2794353 RepID=A0A940SV35_9ENTE|nr:dihydrolipoamide acetyltransferase family protein [Vagococcus allomyrinae]MBP1039943.1 2-oxo acid dehydrogenase subunit E2 [Vagococcus allomyrinae]